MGVRLCYFTMAIISSADGFILYLGWVLISFSPVFITQFIWRSCATSHAAPALLFFMLASIYKSFSPPEGCQFGNSQVYPYSSYYWIGRRDRRNKSVPKMNRNVKPISLAPSCSRPDFKSIRRGTILVKLHPTAPRQSDWIFI